MGGGGGGSEMDQTHGHTFTYTSSQKALQLVHGSVEPGLDWTLDRMEPKPAPSDGL
uniref:Plexin A3 n=1 Tax=Nothobranchius korthausae TaxID=1143690 RepID=A0A1A8HK79_9TELE